MASFNEYENLDEEVKELLENYKYKKATLYEPCTQKNFKECLIGISEEFGLLNIGYTFNPHVDVENETLTTQALVKLVNSVWILLQSYKNMTEKSNNLAERNHILESSNNQLNGLVGKLREKVNLEKNEAKACVASAQRVSDQSNEFYQKLLEARTKLMQVTKQKESTEKALHTKISKLQLENNKLVDKLRNKSSFYTPCSEICDTSFLQIKDRERTQRKVIAKLQECNQNLLKEVLALKEDLILKGLDDINLNKKNM